MASGSRDQNIIIWDCDSWSSMHTLTQHSGDVFLLEFAPDNLRLASVEKNDNRIILWSTQDWEVQQMIQLTSSDYITSIAFSPDSRLLAAGDANGNIWIWQIEGSWQLIE